MGIFLNPPFSTPTIYIRHQPSHFVLECQDPELNCRDHNAASAWPGCGDRCARPGTQVKVGMGHSGGRFSRRQLLLARPPLLQPTVAQVLLQCRKERAVQGTGGQYLNVHLLSTYYVLCSKGCCGGWPRRIQSPLQRTAAFSRSSHSTNSSRTHLVWPPLGRSGAQESYSADVHLT